MSSWCSWLSFGGYGTVEPPPPLSRALLQSGDDRTSNAIIEAFKGDAAFTSFAQKETDGILARDAEDDEKLAAGIKMAVAKGVVPAEPPLEKVTTIDVLGKSADQVAASIIKSLGDAPKSGCVLVLQGLSGTGKGTTRRAAPAAPWSNGNVFHRSVRRRTAQRLAFGPDPTPELLQKLVGCLTFAKVDGKFDTRIKGYGLDLLVSQVQNTTLKEPRVGKNIPTVAKMTQGEVITFAAAAAEAMRADGMNVLMEGRAQTLNHVRTPHRFELTLSEPIIIGMRRAAQRMMAAALEKLPSEGEPTAEEVKATLADALAAMAA